MLVHQVLCLNSHRLGNARAVAANLNFGLCLLVHPQLQAPDLVLNVLVVLLELTIVDNLTHQMLKLFILDSLGVLSILLLSVTTHLLAAWRRPLLVLLVMHFSC